MAERANTFGKYVLLRKLATGGMGEVFLAKQVGPSGFEKLLVIKRILAQHHDKTDYLNMFLSEARLVAYLTHSNIIQIHEMGQIDGDYFIAMEFVRGKSLRDVIDALRQKATRLPLPHVVDLAIKLCDGLGYAHDARDIRGKPMNIIHRDINPHNILVSYTGDLKLIDFGIAKSEMTSVHTATGTIKGKFVYMSPEQSAADPIDRRSDIFSLGIVLYEMLTGENPFVRQNVVLSLEAIQRHAVPPPSAKRADASALDDVLERALQKRPEDRYQTCVEMRDDLRELLRSGAITPEERDVSTFLNELFEEDIEEEDRLLAEADRATSPPGPPPDLRSEEPVPIPEPAQTSRPPEARLPAAPSTRRSSSVPPPRPAGDPSLDEDTRSLRHPNHRPPKPITESPFSDEEPTLGEGLEEMAERSRRLSEQRRASEPPSGEVFTLIPPEDVAPGTEEQLVPPGAFSEGDDGPSTREERVPDEAPSAPRGLLPAPSPTADMPAEDIPDQREAALSEPLPSETRLPAFTRPFAETKEMKKSDLPDALNPSPASTPVEHSIDYDSGSGYAAEDSEQLPAFSGPSRRATVIAGALVFLLAVFAGFWGMKAVLGWWPEEDPVRPVEGLPSTGPLDDIEPVSDPPAAPKPELLVEEPEVEDDPPEVATKPTPRRAKKRPKRRPKSKPTAAKPKPKKPKPEPKVEQPKPEPKVVVAPPAPTKTEPAKTEPKSEPKKTRAINPSRLGIMTVSSSLDARLKHNGKRVGSAPSSVVVRQKTGAIKLSGDDLDYQVTLSYEVTDGGVKLSVRSTPWAIVKHNGIALGKTPRSVGAGARHKLSLIRPGQDAPFVVTIIWNPSSR